MELAGRGRSGIFPIRRCRRCRACLRIGRGICQASVNASKSPAIRRILVSAWLADIKTRGTVERCHRQTPKKTLRLPKPEPRNRRKDLLHAQMTPRPVAAKLVVVVHDLPHQLLDHLLADEPICWLVHLCLSLLVLFLNRGPKSLSMWGAEVGITPGRMKR